jgi:hypothetical protein
MPIRAGRITPINDTSEDAPSYLDLLQAPYSLALKERARWMAERFAGLKTDDMRALIETRIGRWTADFRVSETAPRLKP